MPEGTYGKFRRGDRVVFIKPHLPDIQPGDVGIVLEPPARAIRDEIFVRVHMVNRTILIGWPRESELVLESEYQNNMEDTREYLEAVTQT